MTTQATPTTGNDKAKNDERVFRSKLGDGLSRFLAHVIEHGLEVGRRTPEDFIRHFPPPTIMKALEGQPELRANILVITTGIRPKVALKKSAESCGIDLQIALDEDEADAETIVTLFDPDDRVRYLDHGALWAYVTEGEFWKAGASAEPAAKHLAYMLDRALEDALLTHSDIVEGITIAKLAQLLPRPELEKILTAALHSGRKQKPFVDRDLLSATPTSVLVSHVPLPWLWEQVIVPRIAEARGLVQNEKKAGSPEVASAASPAASPVASPAAPPVPPLPARPSATEIAEPTEPGAIASPPSSGDLDIAVDEVLEMAEEEQPKKAYVPAAPSGSRSNKR